MGFKDYRQVTCIAPFQEKKKKNPPLDSKLHKEKLTSLVFNL